MNSRISAGSTVVDGGGCQRISPLQNGRNEKTVKYQQLYFTARLTFGEPYQRQMLRHAGPTSVNREAELERPSRVACSDLLAARHRFDDVIFRIKFPILTG